MQFICNKIENVHGNYLYIVKIWKFSLDEECVYSENYLYMY